MHCERPDGTTLSAKPHARAGLVTAALGALLALAALIAPSVASGDANGDFFEPPTSPVGVDEIPTEAAVGDFNDDGHDDLAVAARFGDDVTVLLGDGSGAFAEAPGSPLDAGGNRCESLAIADVDGDSNQDLAVVCEGNPAGADGNQDLDKRILLVSIFRGNGDGTFEPVTYEFGPNGLVTEHVFAVDLPGNTPLLLQRSLVIGNLDDDGDADIAIAAEDNTALPESPQQGFVAILLGNGDATFTNAAGSPMAVGTNARQLALGNLNGDAHTDLVVQATDGGDGEIVVLLGDGSGAFTATPDSPLDLISCCSVTFALGDLNGDTNPDLALSSNTDEAAIQLGDGSAGFTSASSRPIATGDPNPLYPIIGNFNGDSNPDLAIPSRSGANPDTATILIGDGGGGFTEAATSPEVLGDSPSAGVAADFDGDAIDDLAIPNTSSDNVTILLSDLMAVGDLTVTKSDSADPVTVGDDFTYTLAVANAGPQEATGLTVSDSLPAAVTYDDAASDSRCEETAPDSGVVECDLGTLAATASDEVVIAVRATAGADPAVNTATASADQADPDGAETGEETVIHVPLCRGEEATIVGTPGADVLTGTPGSDVIHARGGDDIVNAGDGDDRICGAKGADELRGGRGADELVHGAGDDTLYGGDGADLLGGSRDGGGPGGFGDDVLRGGRGRDEVRAGRGEDTLFGGRNEDLLLGGAHADVLRGGRGADTLRGRQGPDVLRGGRGPDLCTGGPGRDRASGTCERVRGVP